jgi:molybdopterin-binding protein
VTGVVGLVEMEATGRHRIVSVITRDAIEELGLAAGVPVAATVKATSVMVERR